MEDFFHSFVLCGWDNVVGPKVVKTWPHSAFRSIEEVTKVDVDEVGTEVSEEKAYSFSEDYRRRTSSLSQPPCKNRASNESIGKYISAHTLTGHLAKSKHTNYDSLNHITLCVPNLGFISQTTTFYCLNLDCSLSLGDTDMSNICVEEPHMTSLTVIFQHNETCLDLFWKLQPLILHLLEKIVERLKVGLFQVKTRHVQLLLTHLIHFEIFLFQNITYHEEPIVFSWLSELYYVVGETIRLRIIRPPGSPQPKETKLTMRKFQLPWDVLITSMLTTLGSCCIVGKDENQVNKVLIRRDYCDESFEKYS